MLERLDVTTEFGRCMDILLDQFDDRREALVQLLGEQEYVDRLVHRQSTRAGLSRGLLRREIFVAA